MSMLALWEEALRHEDRPEEAIALLIEAAAFGANEIDGHLSPENLERLFRGTFDALHIAKHVGRLS